MAPYAHLAVYKVCFGLDWPESDILTGLDVAVADGADVISISIGEQNMPFFQDNIAIASFAAIQKGIFVSCATGNSGPFNGTATNIAPWVLTIGASTTDRKIKATKKLGNNKEFDGESLFQPKGSPSSTLLPLVYAVKFNEYSSVVVSAGYDRSLRAWDCRSHSTEPIRIIDTFLDSVMSICLTKTEIIAGSVDGTVRTFDIRNDGTFERSRKRGITVFSDYAWSSGDQVDVWVQDSWHEAIVMDTNKIDLTSLTVQFPAQSKASIVRSWHVRPTLVWKDDK
ncbi:unnamed protein product [Lactuca saligna]|uniref:Agenet domain-containing protein n=1 Tax=Lactuca saligna TaxID=75948 RepID=A0AA35Y2S2_LACSI|nr:unnamed protein product [Lactuca saligna]